MSTLPSQSHQANLAGPTVGSCVPAPGICQKGVRKSEVRYLSDRKCRHRVSLCIKVAILDLNRTENKPWDPEGEILFPLSEPGLYPDTISPQRLCSQTTTTQAAPLPGSAGSAAPWWPLLGLPQTQGQDILWQKVGSPDSWDG